MYMYKYEGDPLYNSTTFTYYAIHTSYNSFLIDTRVEYVSIQNVIRRVITSPSVSLLKILHLSIIFSLNHNLWNLLPLNRLCRLHLY